MINITFRSDPKIFQRDCGNGGRVDYRRIRTPPGVRVELIGDKKSQDDDYKRLQR
jgi:hypothetical protein